MTKIFCDKCGREIRNNEEDPVFRVEASTLYYGQAIAVEICADCEDKMFQFAEHKEEQNHD